MPRYRLTLEEVFRDADRGLMSRPLYVAHADHYEVVLDEDRAHITLLQPHLEASTSQEHAPPDAPAMWLCEHGKIRGEDCATCLRVVT